MGLNGAAPSHPLFGRAVGLQHRATLGFVRQRVGFSHGDRTGTGGGDTPTLHLCEANGAECGALWALSTAQPDVVVPPPPHPPRCSAALRVQECSTASPAAMNQQHRSHPSTAQKPHSGPSRNRGRAEPAAFCPTDPTSTAQPHSPSLTACSNAFTSWETKVPRSSFVLGRSPSPPRNSSALMATRRRPPPLHPMQQH